MSRNCIDECCDRHLSLPIYAQRENCVRNSTSHLAVTETLCQQCTQSASNGQTICLARLYIWIWSACTFFLYHTIKKKHTIFQAISYRLHSHVKAMRAQEILIKCKRCATRTSKRERIAMESFVRVINGIWTTERRQDGIALQRTVKKERSVYCWISALECRTEYHILQRITCTTST